MSDKKWEKCDNCNSTFHTYKSCTLPKTSWGIILLKIDNEINKYDKTDCDITKEDKLFIKYDKTDLIDTEGIKFESTKDLKKICKNMNDIKFLLIRRKFSLGYIEFISGRYNIKNIEGIMFLFKQMTPIEINNIKKSTFDELWNEFWTLENRKKKHVQVKYIDSKQKFNCLKYKIDVDLALDFYTSSIKYEYEFPEWGYPKGRRQKNESEIECAIREFTEETNYKKEDIEIFTALKPIEENLMGTDGVNYRHIYFVAKLITDKNPEIGINSSNEIGDINFFSYIDTMNIIREHHIEKKLITKKIYMFMLNNMC
jgi:ADP-ribose pyrophosphatase YjhB (NUDIX family)